MDSMIRDWFLNPPIHFRAIGSSGVAGIVPGYQSDMPAYADVLSDREIWAALAYIKSSWPAAIRARQPRNAGSN